MKDVSLNNGRALHPPNIAATLRVSESIATDGQQTDVRTAKPIARATNKTAPMHARQRRSSDWERTKGAASSTHVEYRQVERSELKVCVLGSTALMTGRQLLVAVRIMKRQEADSLSSHQSIFSDD